MRPTFLLWRRLRQNENDKSDQRCAAIKGIMGRGWERCGWSCGQVGGPRVRVADVGFTRTLENILSGKAGR